MSDALGGLALPWQMKRTARAQAEVDKIKAQSEVEVTEIQRRGYERLIHEAGREQQNIEGVLAKALPDVKEGARAKDIEADWLTKFIDKSKIILDEEMQSLWAKILVGEANAPGTFSKRTLEFVDTLDKQDARDFTTLCGFCCYNEVEGFVPIIFGYEGEFYRENGLNFDLLNHLDSLGLNTYIGISTYTAEVPQNVHLKYFDEELVLTRKEGREEFELGRVLLTKLGKELAPISGATKVEGFLEYITGIYAGMHIASYCPLNFHEPAAP